MRDREDRGAVAVVVALAVTFVLIPVAALAVDLGSMYVREASLQATADSAVRAGAEELALLQRDALGAADVMNAARTKVVQTLCAGVTRTDDPWAGSCTADSTWALDDDPSNGEVSFYLGKPRPDHTFDPVTQDAAGALATTLITGIRVVTPPSRVTFGLAGAFTHEGHADPQKAATAGIFTVLPRAGFFPMYLRSTDHGGFCTRSAPARTWQDTHPGGACNPAVARGNLVAPRTNSTEDSHRTVWNAATGFDRAHLPLTQATFAPQLWPTTSLLRELSPGLFGGSDSHGAPPRLKGTTCRGGNSASSGPWSGLESAFLADFLSSSVEGKDKNDFRNLVQSGTTPSVAQRGWLEPDILQCGRLAAAPVLSGVDVLPYNGLATTTYSVTRWRLIWLDDRLWSTDTQPVSTGSCLSRGFYWADPDYPTICRNDLRAYTGYVLDPLLLPATVSDTDAANALDEFVGSGLPVTIRLLRDVSDPPPR